MIDLNDEKLVSSLDKARMLESIRLLPDQCRQAWEETKKIQIPSSYMAQTSQIIVSGMGGSALGAHIIKSLFHQDLSLPVEIINDYHLPGYVDSRTLLLLSSYSGSTEETLSTAFEGLKRQAKIVGITTGGKLGSFLEENHFPAYIFKPQFNPCGQPRIGLGYSIVGQIGLLRKIGLLKLDENDFYQTIDSLSRESETLKKEAKAMAAKIQDKIVEVIGASHLSGNAHVLANQLNENSKNFAGFFFLPELNHHLMEGLKNPKQNKLIFLFLRSLFYDEKIKLRLKLTQEIIAKNNLPFLEFESHGENKLAEVFQTLLFGSFLSFYLSIIYNQDPSVIPWVDYFKEKLAKAS
ncbi:MAG: SIS domain-containing protein [Patescibacteria group bacterium]|nr:SIS domain-containing protein [Patescibacteria group bacterium]MCL5095371.1 SIS domain-containing protein [Patescibacteria group bacterium]